MKQVLKVGFLSLLLCCGLLDNLLSQENNKIIYDKNYFEKYNIVSVIDAIKRIPGVEAITEGDGSGSRSKFDLSSRKERRGFGSSGTAILINGERLSSKANNVMQTLSRIQADALIRIEVIRGSEAGLDVRSEGIIINVIVDSSSLKSSGTWETALKILSSGNSIWTGEGSWSTKVKNTDIVIGLKRIGFISSRYYDEFHLFGDSSIYQYRIRETFEFKSGFQASIDVSSKLTPIDTIRINTLIWFDGSAAEPQNQNYYGPEDSLRENPSSFINWDRTDSFDGWEFGGDWEHDFNGNHSLKIRTVLSEDNKHPRVSQYQRIGMGDLSEIGREITDRTEIERILRASMSSSLGPSTFEYGFEAAFNKLDRNFLLLTVDDQGGLTDTDLSNTQGTVEEDRYEGFLSYNFPIEDNIRIEIALNYEWSEIRQSGDVNESREFQYWKPRIDLKWDYESNRQIRLTIERSVGQIDFDDFISSYDVFEERIRAGNPDLQPDTSWEIQLEHEWRLPRDGGVITLEGFATQVDGPVERVPVGGYAAIGNLGTAERQQIKLNGSLRIEDIVPGGVFSFMGYLQHSEVIDPLTKQKRDLAWFPTWEFTLGLRQDIPGGKYSWGAKYSSVSMKNIYDPFLWGRWAQDPFLQLNFSAKLNSRLTLKLKAENVLVDFGTGRKIIYNGFKSNNDILVTEHFKTKGHSLFKIELEGTF